MIRFDHVTYSYGTPDAETPALREVSLEVVRGAVTVVLGSNGSGKSTLVRLANGLMAPDSGDVTVDGVSTGDEARTRQIRESVGVVFQHPDDQIVATTVEDDVAFGPENLGLPRAEIRARVDSALAAVGLTGMERREPHLLSGGQKQRLVIAGALAMNPAFLVLDEPASMLDPRGRRDVLAIIRELRNRGHGVLHVTHDLADADGADRAVVLDQGRVAFDGTIADLLADTALLGRCGLALPPIAVLGEELRRAGAPVTPGLLSVDALVDAAWR